MRNIVEIIDSLLLSKGITGYRMCSDLKMSRSFMTELRKGRIKGLTLETASKIADYFDVSIDYIMGNKKEPATSLGSGPSANALLFDKLLKEQGIDPRKLTESEVRRMIAVHKTLSESKD